MVRGIIMVIMALDHTREFFHIDAQVFNPTDLSKTTTILFFTRWITHFCAPAFVFLSGISAGLSLQRKSKKELSWFLFTRGLWLIILEITLIRFGFTFNLYYDVTFFEVIYTLGACMMILSVLVYLPQQVVFALGVILILGHDALIGFKIPDTLRTLFIAPGFIPVDATHGIFVSYPVIPWLGIMLAGYGAARLYTHIDGEKRKKILLYAGVITIVLFIIIRFTKIHGDLDTWSTQKNPWFTFLSFINCVKYPVTLLFTLMTLGPILIVLSLTERSKGWISEKAIVIGRVPLFYFIIHFYILHIVALGLYIIIFSKSISEIDFHLQAGLGGISPGTGYSLVWTYVAWITLIILLYPICRWYNNYKSSHTNWWLSYL